MSDRAVRIEAFLAAAGWQGAVRQTLAGDASFRRYDRVTRGAETAVLMDAPPPHEDIRPFAAITRHLRSLGYSAPEILAEDAEAGLLLLEDLGDATYTRALAGGADEATLYERAVDLLIHLHGRHVAVTVPEDLPPYDAARLMAEADLLVDWYLPRLTGRATSAGVKHDYRDIWRALLPRAQPAEPTLVLRDFHADNLIWLPERGGIRAVGLLDYQDAVAGAPAYDLMSLIEDARRDLAPGLEAALLARYRARVPALDWPAFQASYRILAAQRHCKVIGIFTRLAERDGKYHYLSHIPRVWRRLEAACRDPMLEPLRAWLDRNVPGERRSVTIQGLRI